MANFFKAKEITFISIHNICLIKSLFCKQFGEIPWTIEHFWFEFSVFFNLLTEDTGKKSVHAETIFSPDLKFCWGPTHKLSQFEFIWYTQNVTTLERFYAIIWFFFYIRYFHENVFELSHIFAYFQVRPLARKYKII